MADHTFDCSSGGSSHLLRLDLGPNLPYGNIDVWKEGDIQGNLEVDDFQAVT